MIAKCGALPDFVLQYAPNLRTLLPKQSHSTDGGIRRCFLYFNNLFYDKEEGCNDCRVSCSEMTIKHTVTKKGDYGPTIELRFDSKSLTNITETAAYPAEKFVTDIGGWLGLFSGMSALSVVEIILFVVLSLVALYRKIKQYLSIRRLNINPTPA